MWSHRKSQLSLRGIQDNEVIQDSVSLIGTIVDMVTFLATDLKAGNINVPQCYGHQYNTISYKNTKRVLKIFSFKLCHFLENDEHFFDVPSCTSLVLRYVQRSTFAASKHGSLVCFYSMSTHVLSLFPSIAWQRINGFPFGRLCHYVTFLVQWFPKLQLFNAVQFSSSKNQ